MDRLLTPEDLAQYLQTTVAALAQARYQGRGVPFCKDGRRASVLLGAQCVTEPAPDDDDGSSEGANKSVAPMVIEAKAAALRARLGCIG